MEDLGFTQGLTTIFGFLAVCIAMIWKVVSDKKDDGKSKENAEKIAKILERKKVLSLHRQIKHTCSHIDTFDRAVQL